ncbi:hypothetical protein ABWU78_07925, partial [Cellulosimicrobium sp. CpK407]
MRRGPLLERGHVKLSARDLIEQFRGLNLIELNEFVKAFEETFEITAAAPAAIAV